MTRCLRISEPHAPIRTQEQVSEILGIGLRTVKRNEKQAMRKLREAFKGFTFDELVSDLREERQAGQLRTAMLDQAETWSDHEPPNPLPDRRVPSEC